MTVRPTHKELRDIDRAFYELTRRLELLAERNVDLKFFHDSKAFWEWRDDLAKWIHEEMNLGNQGNLLAMRARWAAGKRMRDMAKKPPTRTLAFIVTLELPERAAVDELRQYIEEEVKAGVGQRPPDDPLFNLNRDSVRVVRGPLPPGVKWTGNDR